MSKEEKQKAKQIEKEQKEQMKLMEKRREWRENQERDGISILDPTLKSLKLLYYRVCRLEELLGIGEYEMLDEDKDLRERIIKTLKE